jgi:hypothetical protein
VNVYVHVTAIEERNFKKNLFNQSDGFVEIYLDDKK